MNDKEDFLDWAIGNSFEYNEETFIAKWRKKKLKKSAVYRENSHQDSFGLSMFKSYVELNFAIRMIRLFIFWYLLLRLVKFFFS